MRTERAVMAMLPFWPIDERIVTCFAPSSAAPARCDRLSPSPAIAFRQPPGGPSVQPPEPVAAPSPRRLWPRLALAGLFVAAVAAFFVLRQQGYVSWAVVKENVAL